MRRGNILFQQALKKKKKSEPFHLYHWDTKDKKNNPLAIPKTLKKYQNSKMKGQPKASNRWKIKNQLNKVEHAWWQTDLESGWVRLLPCHLRARLGQSQEMLCFPGSQLSLRVFIPVLCLPSPEYAGYKAILSSFSITSRNSSCRQICYQSLTLEFEKTTQKQKPVVSLAKSM